MIDLIAAAGIGGIIGFGACAVFTAGKVADAHYLTDETLEATTRRGVAVALELVEARDEADEARNNEAAANRIALEATDAHDRCADALETARNRIEYALEQVTPGSNATVKRIARILRGEQG